MGKSTHARLWQQQFPGARVFNDDKPALRLVEDRWYAYGTPWSGKHDISVNTGVPVAGVAVLYVIFSLINWAKTYFTVTEDMLIVERNTLIKRKNTIALKNISNVNLEQGLLSMLFDTCRVKLDTNTLSTANETDVTIVLKRQDAEELRQLLLCGAENSDDDEQPAKNVEFDEGKSFEVNTRDIIANGFFSLSFSVVIIFLGAAAFGISMLSEALKDPEMGMGDAISVFLSLTVFAVGLIWSMAKKFIDYVDFRVERAEDKVYLSYGLLKKVTYSIPVSKMCDLCRAENAK